MAARAECHRLSEEIDRTAQVMKARQAERESLALLAEEREAARLDIVAELRRREEEVAGTRACTEEVRAESANLLEELATIRDEKLPLEHEIVSLRASISAQEKHGDPEIASLEAQLVEAIQVQGSLRFSLRQSHAEAEQALKTQMATEARAVELRTRLEEARASYMYAIDALDRKVAGLEREGYEAERVAERLEQALEDTAFKMRMADVELHRWSA